MPVAPLTVTVTPTQMPGDAPRSAVTVRRMWPGPSATRTRTLRVRAPNHAPHWPNKTCVHKAPVPCENTSSVETPSPLAPWKTDTKLKAHGSRQRAAAAVLTTLLKQNVPAKSQFRLRRLCLGLASSRRRASAYDGRAGRIALIQATDFPAVSRARLNLSMSSRSSSWPIHIRTRLGSTPYCFAHSSS